MDNPTTIKKNIFFFKKTKIKLFTKFRINKIINKVFSLMNLFLFFKQNSINKTIRHEQPKTVGTIQSVFSLLKIGKLIKIASLMNFVVKTMNK